MKLKTKELTYCAMFAALIAVGAFIKIDIPLPFYTMHFTFQWFFVLIAAFLLGAKLGTLSVVVYLIIGLVGVPVFAAGGGPGYVLRAGFGFLLGFAVAAYVMGRMSERLKKYNAKNMILPSAVGLVIYYAIGAVYFYLIKNLYVGDAIPFTTVVVQYCLITVIPDFILCVLACLLCGKLRPLLVRFLE